MNRLELLLLSWVRARSSDEATDAIIDLDQHLRDLDRHDLGEIWLPGNGIDVPGEWCPPDAFWADESWDWGELPEVEP